MKERDLYLCDKKEIREREKEEKERERKKRRERGT